MTELVMPVKKTPISNEQLTSAIERLDLADGDVLIVTNTDLLPRLTALRIKAIDFPLPIIPAREGMLTKIHINDLRRVVREYDERNRPELPQEGVTSSAPNAEGW